MAVRAYLAVGTNIGEREHNLLGAVKGLQTIEGITVVDLSAVYETDPVGYTDQAAFLNMAVEIETSLSPEALLESVLRLEQELGRVRIIRWGPRTIDIDILLYGEESVALPHLQIPHPEMTGRAFVLVPLNDIFDHAQLIKGKLLKQWLEQANDRKGVRRWGTLNLETGSAHFEN
ncbi:2-amino-4-hydroxy-6-hydroxymethyldihydropteridine diphosphokinase [Brevibacillus fluminis]|uniref:2-amino-4-hydroxy-6-hydroxymethyldihydropteridine diphosphokinase n=1 Tax=Brevibacillus fluminis TaxID=511487 RepID=A0A3M8D536_9BACL|nr:2-amino-4-hydroxy-6-hydroxymethyldihydropteridine diphosphokinase [Brevibacillus fluminis]RNB82829.1 2-amino-4-hydroxy-6-hydroxymethyldihydropteridine diphosphokinase [Brevibacillus fluminis]